MWWWGGLSKYDPDYALACPTVNQGREPQEDNILIVYDVRKPALHGCDTLSMVP